MSAGVSPVPDEAVEAAARAYYESQPRAKHSTASWAGLDELAKQHFRRAARAALTAATPSLHEGIMAEMPAQRDAALAANQHLRDEVARLQRELDDMGCVVDGMKTGAAALREGIAAEVLGPVRESLDEYRLHYFPDPHGGADEDYVNPDELRAALPAPVQAAEPKEAQLRPCENLVCSAAIPVPDVYCSRHIPAQAAEEVPCAWCDAKATGTAGHMDGRYHPSCGAPSHGFADTFRAAEEVGGDA